MQESSFVSPAVYALRDFRDSDRILIFQGQFLGELHKGGFCRKCGQMWWTQHAGKVTSCFTGSMSDYVTPEAP